MSAQYHENSLFDSDGISYRDWSVVVDGPGIFSVTSRNVVLYTIGILPMSWEPFAQFLYFIFGLVITSRWPLIIFRWEDQRSRVAMQYNKQIISAHDLEKPFLDSDISCMGWSLVLEISVDYQFKRSPSAILYSSIHAFYVS